MFSNHNNKSKLVANRSGKLDLLKQGKNPSTVVKAPTKLSGYSHATIDYKTTLAQCQKSKLTQRVQDSKLHQNPLNNFTNKNIGRKSNSQSNLDKDNGSEQLSKRQTSQFIHEQPLIRTNAASYKSQTVGIAFPSIGNSSLNSKNYHYGENCLLKANFPAALTSDVCMSPSKFTLSDISPAVNSVQEAWNKFVNVSRIIGKLECSMVLTKIDHVLNDEYLAHYQKHPFANDAFNEQVSSDRMKMDALKEKIFKAGNLEGVVKNLSKTLEAYRLEEKKLMEELKNCRTALTSRRRLAMNSAAAIRDQLLQTSSKLKELYDQYRKSSTELEALENDLALLLNDAHPTYSLLFRYRGDSNKEAAEEELRYMSLVYAIQQRRLGLFLPPATIREDSYEMENDSDWLWLLQYTSDNNISCSSSGSSEVSAYEPELANPFARSNSANCFSQDLSAALKLGRHSFEQLYLTMPEINLGNFQFTQKISMDETIERMNGESSLLFLRRLRHRGLHLHMLLGSISQELTEQLSVLQDLKHRQGSSLIAEEFRFPMKKNDDSSILSFPVIYKEDPELETTSYDNTMASQLKKSQKKLVTSSAATSHSGKIHKEIHQVNQTESDIEKNYLHSAVTNNPMKKSESVGAMSAQLRAKPSDFLDTSTYLSTRKIGSLSTRSGCHNKAISSSNSCDFAMDFNASSMEEDHQILPGSVITMEHSNNSLIAVSSADKDRCASPIALLKDLLHSTVKKKLMNKNQDENSDFVQFSAPMNDLLFNYDDLDELNKLIVKYLADKRNMNLSQDTEDSLSTFNKVLKVLKVQVLSDLLKRDLAVADEIQASQVRLLTIPAVIHVTPVKSSTTAAAVDIHYNNEQSVEAHELDESLLEKFKRNGEMILISPTVAAVERAISNSPPSAKVPTSTQMPTNLQSFSEDTVNLSDIYKLESFDEFIEAISNNGLADGISDADDSKRLDAIKSQLSMMHKDSHAKKSIPLASNHSTRSSCIICTHLPQIFGSFSETCLPVANTQKDSTEIQNDSERASVNERAHILATGNLPKTVHSVDGAKDCVPTVTSTNKIIVLNKGKSTKVNDASTNLIPSSMQEGLSENCDEKNFTIDISKVGSMEEKQKNYLQYCSPTRNPLSRQSFDFTLSRQKVESAGTTSATSSVPNALCNDAISVIKSSDDLHVESSSNSAPRTYPSVTVISVHPTVTPRKAVSGDYVSPPSEVAYRSISDNSVIHEVPDYGSTPSIVHESSQKVIGDSFIAANSSSSHNDNDLLSVKLFDTLQKIHSKYFGSLRKKSRAASTKSIDDLEIEYSSPIMLKNEFIDRVLLGIGDSHGHDADPAVFQTSCDDMSTSIEEEDLSELSTLLASYKSASNPTASGLRHIPSALSTLKLFALKKKQMTLSLCSNLKSDEEGDRDGESTVFTNEQTQNQIVPTTSLESSTAAASIGMLIGLTSLSDSRQHSNVSSLSFDSVGKRSASSSIHVSRLNAALNSRSKSDLGLHTVIEKLEKMKSQLHRDPAGNVQFITSKISLSDHLERESAQSTAPNVPSDDLRRSPLLQEHIMKSTLHSNEVTISANDPNPFSSQESENAFRKSDEESASANVAIFVADHREDHSIVSPLTLDELFISEDSDSAAERKAKLLRKIDGKISIQGGADQENMNKVLLEFLGKQQRDIEELKKTQENIHELLQKRDTYSQSNKLPSTAANDASQAASLEAEVVDEIEQSVDDDLFSHKVIDVESAEKKDSNLSHRSIANSESNLEVEKAPTISWDAAVKASEETFPHNSGDRDAALPQSKVQSSSVHSRQPSFADSMVSALTGCTGLTSADMHASKWSGNNGNGLVLETQGSNVKTPPKLQRLRFESFLEAAQSFSPNYQYSNKSTVSPKSNNPVPTRELEEMVAFLSSRIERCEAKKLEWSEHELLDRNTHTIAIDPTDGKSKAFVEVIVKSAKNVPVMKKVTKSSDCYVEIKLVRAQLPRSSTSKAATQYEKKSESIFRTSVKQNTLFPEWMEDFKITDITDLTQDKLLVTLRDSSKGSSACIGPERDEIIGQAVLHLMGGDGAADENTNILLDQHMHSVNLTLSAPQQSLYSNQNPPQQPHAHARLSAGRAPMVPMSAKKAPITSKRNSFSPSIARSPLSPTRRELGPSSSSAAAAADIHLHGCSVRLVVKLFFSKRKYWEHQQLDFTRLLYKLVGSSAPDLLPALYPQLKDFQAIHSASPATYTASPSSSSSSGITKGEIEKIRQMMLRETQSVTSPDFPAAARSRDPESSTSFGGTSSSTTSIPKYSDILSGGSVSGMTKIMSHIRGLREKPLTTFTSHKGQQQSSRATPQTSSSRASFSSVPSSSSPAPRVGYRRNSLSGGIGGGSIASGHTSASSSSSSNSFGNGHQRHAVPYSNAFVFSKPKVK